MLRRVVTFLAPMGYPIVAESGEEALRRVDQLYAESSIFIGYNPRDFHPMFTTVLFFPLLFPRMFPRMFRAVWSVPESNTGGER